MVYGNPCVLNGRAAERHLRRARHRCPRGHPRRHRDHRRAASTPASPARSTRLLRLLRQRDRQPDPRQRQRGPRRGLLPRGPARACCACRNPDGSLVVPLHAQRQRLRRLPADPHARPATADTHQLQAGQRRRALQLGDLEQRAVEHPDPAGPDRRPGRQHLRARAPVRPRGLRRARHPAHADQWLRRRPRRRGAGDHRLPARPGRAPHRPRGLRRREDLHRLSRHAASWPGTASPPRRRPSCTRPSPATGCSGST